MVKVMRTGTTRYRGVTYKPYQEFMVEDKDKDEMIKLGCVVIEDKVVNPRKVEPKEETKEEIKEETKEPTVSKMETVEKKEKKD